MARRKKSTLDRPLPVILALVLLALIVLSSEDLAGRLFLIFCSLIILAVICWNGWRRWKQLQRLRSLDLENVDAMHGHVFEHYVGRLLRQQGFRITVTKASGDLGVDIIARKDGIGYAIQCKRSTEDISRRAVSDAVAGKHHYKCTQSMVVTNRYFRAGARELAKSTNCILVDRDELSGWVDGFRRSGAAEQVAGPERGSRLLRLARWIRR